MQGEENDEKSIHISDDDQYDLQPDCLRKQNCRGQPVGGSTPASETGTPEPETTGKPDDSTPEPAETAAADPAPADGYDLVILDTDKVVYEEKEGAIILNRIEMKSDGTDIARITYTVKNTSSKVLSMNDQGKEPLLNPGESHTETYEISTMDADGMGYLFGGRLYDPDVIDQKDNNQLMMVFQYVGFFNVIDGELVIEQFS